jgi:hypothetical protein
MFNSNQIPDEQLAKILDRSMHWLIYCVGLNPVSAYSLREALVDSRRIETTAHVLQRIRTLAGEVTIEREQVARLWASCGEPKWTSQLSTTVLPFK